MKITVGLLLVFAAVWGILDAAGVTVPFVSVVGGISMWQIIIGVLLIAFIVKRLSKLKFPTAVFGMSLLFMVFERNIATIFGLNENIINNWVLLPLMVMLCFGLHLIIPKRVPGGGKAIRHSMGAHTVYIESGTFSERHIGNTMGSTVVRFENPELYSGNGVLHIENNMASTHVYIPKSWRVVSNIENNLGTVNTCGAEEAPGPILHLTGENNMGTIQVRRL